MTSIQISKRFLMPAEDLNKESSELVEKIATAHSLPKQIARLLVDRGVASSGDAELFLNPSLKHLLPPLGMKGMREAVDIIIQALEEKKPIVVYGDYDADGVCGSAALSLFLEKIGATVYCRMPDRLQEGYGLHVAAIDEIENQYEGIRRDGAVLVTVDCGISNKDEVAHAKLKGWRVIITDHHQPPQELPDADAILNPLQPGCGFSYKHLAGSGVAFYLMMGVRTELVSRKFWKTDTNVINLKSFLDIVCVGTVADMVPMTGLNRILVKAGLQVLSEAVRPGVIELLEHLGLNKGQVHASDIGFKIAPMINAAGRLGDVRSAYDLLVTADRSTAARLVVDLAGLNGTRRERTDELNAMVRPLVHTAVERGAAGLVFYLPEMHQGLSGLVASRIMNEYHRPTFVFADTDGGLLKGSCRSLGDLDIIEILENIGDILVGYGGHKYAAGVTIEKEKLLVFEERLHEEIIRRTGGELIEEIVKVECTGGLNDFFCKRFTAGYEKLSPFGKGNPEPLFAFQGPVKISEARKVGAGSLKFVVKEGDMSVSGIGFGLSGKLSHCDQLVQLIFTMQLNEFRGQTKWEIRAEEILSVTH